MRATNIRRADLSRDVTQRENRFLSWLLDRRFLPQRDESPTKKRLRKLDFHLRGLTGIGVPHELEMFRQMWSDDVRQRMYYFRSKILKAKKMGPENTFETWHIYTATLIARKRNSKNPYAFVFKKLRDRMLSSPKAIEMRVRRQEQRLGTEGGLPNLKWNLQMLYAQFLSVQYQYENDRLVALRMAGRIPGNEYVRKLERLTWPTAEENRWLDSLCSYAKIVRESSVQDCHSSRSHASSISSRAVSSSSSPRKKP